MLNLDCVKTASWPFASRKSRIATKIVVFSLTLAFATLGLTALHAQAAVSDWHKGISVFPSNPNDFESDSFHQSLRNAHDMGATDVALIIPIYQANTNSSDIYPGWDTPTDESLASAINFAHSLGMKVMLKPHLGPQDGSWRAYIDAYDRDAWFRNYGSYLNHIGDIGSRTGAEGMTIATELISMAAYTSNPDNTSRWESIISDLRTHFGGYLTYSANWGGSFFTEEVAHIGFWPSLDYIGISAYYPLAEGQYNPSVDALVGSWNYWDTAKIRALHNQYSKDILFTEIGYRSAENSHNRPFDWPQGGYSGTEQSNDYQALFSYWNNQSYMKGLYIWNWESNPDHGWEGNTDYTPQHKPAEELIKSWWSGAGGDNGGNGNSTPPETSTVSGDWTISAHAGPITAGTPSDLRIDAAITGKAQNVIVDVEIYDANNTRVHQKYFERQNIDSTSPLSLDPQFTPSGAGPYVVSVGIFNSDWTNLFGWHHNVITLASSGQNGGGDNGSGGQNGGGGQNQGPATMNIWWPTDGASVSGVQLWKAMVTNRNVSDYTMYWQVDGDALNAMFESNADYPHKEAWVDLGPWTWRGDGPYQVRFIAKDSAGNSVAEQSVNITVSH